MGDAPAPPGGGVAGRGEFLTRYPMEVKTFVWRIKDLSTIMTRDFWPSSHTSIQFDAGEDLQIPSKWKVELFPDQTFLKLKLLRVQPPVAEGGETLKNVVCDATLKRRDDPQKILTIVTLHPETATSILKRDDLKLTLVGGELSVHLKFVMCGPNPVTVRGKRSDVTKKMMKDAREDVAKSLGALLETGYNSDFVIKVKRSDEWVEMKAHKAILGSRCKYFERMLATEMTESRTATLEIVDESPECMKLLLKWIYTGILDEDWKKIPEEMIKAGDKYGLTLLVQFLDTNLHRACNFGNAINLRDVAKFHGLAIAATNIRNFIADNLDMVLD